MNKMGISIAILVFQSVIRMKTVRPLRDLLGGASLYTWKLLLGPRNFETETLQNKVLSKQGSFKGSRCGYIYIYKDQISYIYI